MIGDFGTRLLQPEILDYLAPSDPRAIRSRKDLVRVNRWMVSPFHLSNAIRSLPLKSGFRWLDIGSGDGRTTMAVSRNLGTNQPGSLILLDSIPVIDNSEKSRSAPLGYLLQTITDDVFSFLAGDSGEFDLITCNLFLHHFEDRRLTQLLELVAEKTRFFVASEPSRSPWSFVGSKLLWLIGCNDVTRHDAAVSVKAGFSFDELSEKWTDTRFEKREYAVAPFSHLFIAKRIDL